MTRAARPPSTSAHAVRQPDDQFPQLAVLDGSGRAPEEGQPMGPLIYLHMALGIAILAGTPFERRTAFAMVLRSAVWMVSLIGLLIIGWGLVF